MAEADILLFSYGTLRDPAVQQALFSRLLDAMPDALLGYARDWIAIGDDEVVRVSGETHHPILRATGDPAERIEGAVLRLTAAELATTDGYEGETYRRIAVRLASGVEAFVYVAA